MIRKNAVSVKVKAPSRGLVTRWPGETADRFYGNQPDMASLYTGMLLQRACAVAENMRFEDGVMCNAPGYKNLQFTVELTSPAGLIYEGNLIGSINKPLALVAGTSIYSVTKSYDAPTDTYKATLSAPIATVTAQSSTGYRWRGADFYDKIIFAQRDNQPVFWLPSSSTYGKVPGLPSNSTYDGVESFFGHLIFWKDDILTWSDLNAWAMYIPVGATINSQVFKASNITQPAVGGNTNNLTISSLTGGAMTSALVPGQYVWMQNGTDYNFYQVASSPAPTTTTVTLTLLDKVGHTGTGTITGPITFFTVDANEAGTAQIVGANTNGPIFQVVAAGDVAFIFKEWSILSLQYVGQSSGTFYVHTEMTREGLLGRNALVNLGNGTVVFLGHRELYTYTGGSSPTPVCRQYARQLLSEVDRSQLDQIQIVHRYQRNEVWVMYPTTGGQKVLVWNYVEDTASLDYYPSNVTTANRATWTADVPWGLVPTNQSWATYDTGTFPSWSSFEGTGSTEVFLVALSDNSVINHGQTYDRNGAAYTSLAETMDYDFGDNAIFKYVDVVHVGLDVRVPGNVARNLYVQVGTRPTLDASITWTAPQAIQVQGNANFTAKVNPGGAGRYIRLRFYSQDPGVQWRISSFEIFARPGGTY